MGKRFGTVQAWSALGAFALLGLQAGCGSGTAEVPPPATLRLRPAQADLKVGGTLQVRAEDGQGNPVRATYSVVEAQGGSIDASGRYAAPLSAGTFHLRAASDEGAVAEAAVAVSAYQDELRLASPSLYTRVDHSASLLVDGSVLLAGGLESSLLERYLPATGTFVQAGDLGAKRWAHQATELPGGTVLFTGGLGASGVLATAQSYDPVSGVRPAGSMVGARMLHAAAALADGRVLLAGGLPGAGSDTYATASAELYDPATGHFTAVGGMGAPRTGHTATRLADGRILVCGGRDSTCVLGCLQRVWSSAECFDPRTGAFSPVGDMAQARYGHTATLLPDGRVLIAGGTTPDLPDTDVSAAIEVFDPATGRFSPAGSLLRPRSHHTATLLTDGQILFAGGRTYGEGTLASATLEVFDPGRAQSRLVTSSWTTRYRHTATRLHSGEVILAGGTEGGGGIKLTEAFR